MTTSPRIDRSVPTAAWIVIVGLVALLGGAVVAFAGPLPVVGLFAGLLLVAAVVKAPGVLLGAYLLIPYYKGELGAYSPIDLTVLLAVANAAQVLFLVLDGRRRRIAVIGTALWLCIGVMVLSGVLYAPDQSLALNKTVVYWALVMIPILPAAIRVGSEPREVAALLWTFFVMGLVTVALGIVQLSTIDRLTVLGMNTIQVGRAALLVPLVGVLYVLPQGRPLATIVTLIAIPASLIVSIGSGSRGPLLVLAFLAAVAAVRYLVMARAGRSRVVALAGALILLIVVAIAVAGPSLPALSVTRFASLLEFAQASNASLPGTGGETSAAARVVLFQFAIHLWTLSPLIGTGTAGFEVLSGSSLGPYADVYPHNALLQVSAEHGLLGLALFVAVVGVGLLRRLPPGRTSLTLRVLFTFFLLNAMVSGDIFTDRETLGLLMLILAFEVPVVASSRGVASGDPDSVPVMPRSSWQVGVNAARSGSAQRQPAMAPVWRTAMVTESDLEAT